MRSARRAVVLVALSAIESVSAREWVLVPTDHHVRVKRVVPKDRRVPVKRAVRMDHHVRVKRVVPRDRRVPAKRAVPTDHRARVQRVVRTDHHVPVDLQMAYRLRRTDVFRSCRVESLATP
jgi:hypothetical protein